MGAAVAGMGIAMPSCPGQQAMQQQVDDLQKHETALNQKIMSLEGQVRSLNGDMSQVKQLLDQVSRAVLAQKDSMAQMEMNVQKLVASRSSAPAKHGATKPAAKSSGKKHR